MTYKTQTPVRMACPPLATPRVLQEHTSTSSYARLFKGRGIYVPNISNRNIHENCKLIVEVHDKKGEEDSEDWLKITYDTLDGRAYGVIFSPERVFVFLDRYDPKKGYDPCDKSVERDNAEPSDLSRIVRAHKHMLETLPDDVKAKLMPRL